uniref:DNA repair protein complementing XP-A cells-like n=1 Tax=Styela clava TaxID=7725 RepID=UPI001939D838|nr:DNA repair protein complementing XP-A cells-like [Styela clava]
MEALVGADCHQKDDARQKLTPALKARIERNRQKALLLRQSRLAENSVSGDTAVRKSGVAHKLVDTGGGFFIEEDEESHRTTKYKRVEEPAPALCGDENICEDCNNKFRESYLLKTFNHPTCDKCKDLDEKHKLITKTEAKSKYQLNDIDLEKREPILKFFSRKNPHNSRWGEMKLYLESQVKERALEIYDSFQEIEEKRETKNVKKEAARKKKYQKVLNNLRKEVRSSLYTKDMGNHEHDYGLETCKDDENDIWTKTCKTCGHELTYEKM